MQRPHGPIFPTHRRKRAQKKANRRFRMAELAEQQRDDLRHPYR